MTRFFIRHSERSEESHRRTDDAYVFHFSRGIFRCAQYDVLFFTRHSERSEESHRVTDGAYTFHLSREIAAVAALPRNDNEKTNCRGRNESEKTNWRRAMRSKKCVVY